MIPRVATTGHSFKGAGLYYLHDKEAKTKDRVAWTHTHNLPTNDPDKAFKWMAHTAMNADRLKRKAGVPLSGRKQKAGTVYSFSLAWHPEQNPDKETMMGAAMETLGLLQLQDHEAVFVAHNDTAHPHVNVIANLIHPEHGKKAVMSYDFLTMSQWAEGVERDNGKIYCEQRVLNNEMRRNGKSLSHSFNMVKHRDKELGRKETIQQLYDQAKDGHDLKAKLQANGYVLAQGDRRGFVLVDKNDKVFSLSRQLKGQRAKDIKARLSDLQDLPHVKEVLQPPVYDRDQYETERQQKVVDAAIEAEKRKDMEQTGKTEERHPEQPNQPSVEEKAKKAAIYSRGYDHGHLRKLDAIREWEQRSDRMRAQLHRQQEVQYKRGKSTGGDRHA